MAISGDHPRMLLQALMIVRLESGPMISTSTRVGGGASRPLGLGRASDGPRERWALLLPTTRGGRPDRGASRFPAGPTRY